MQAKHKCKENKIQASLKDITFALYKKAFELQKKPMPTNDQQQIPTPPPPPPPFTTIY